MYNVSIASDVHQPRDNMRFLFSIVLFAVVGLSSQRSTTQDDHYVAAVVEYFLLRGISTETNINNYEALVRQAVEQNADLIVFPEGTLTNETRSVPVPFRGLLQDFPVPALRPDLYDDVLVAISAAARDNQIYVVINVRESLDCTQPQQGEECPQEKVYLFNTNVVLDRSGAVIDRYRKINLHGENTSIITSAFTPDLGIFMTDFGVTFGHYIGVELLFQVPAVQIVQKHNIKNIISPALWASEMPYLTTIQIQESYAFTMDVNFLGAGANSVGLITSAGSGIYSGKAGALVSHMEIDETRLLVAKVPKIPGNVDEIYPGPIYGNPLFHNYVSVNEDPSLTAHVTRPLVQGEQDFTLVDRDISCRFQVNLRNRTSTRYHYRAAAFSGVRWFGEGKTFGTRSCSIFFCFDSTKKLCGRRYTIWSPNFTVHFEDITITGTMPTAVKVPELEADNSVIFPVSLTTFMMPLEAKDYIYTKNITGNVTVHTMTLNNRDHELYSFGLWGRVFETDGQDFDPPVEDEEPSQPGPPGGGAWVHSLSNALLIMMLAVVKLNQ